jgi:hypothetical protein
VGIATAVRAEWSASAGALTACTGGICARKTGFVGFSSVLGLTASSAVPPAYLRNVRFGRTPRACDQ